MLAGSASWCAAGRTTCERRFFKALSTRRAGCRHVAPLACLLACLPAAAATQLDPAPTYDIDRDLYADLVLNRCHVCGAFAQSEPGKCLRGTRCLRSGRQCNAYVTSSSDDDRPMSAAGRLNKGLGLRRPSPAPGASSSTTTNSAALPCVLCCIRGCGGC